MIVEYGNYRHAINTTGVTIASDIEENEAGVPHRINFSVSLEGRLRNPTPQFPDALDPIIREMQAYYSIPGQDFGLLHNDGSRSAAYWFNHKTIGGIRPKMMAFPNYMGGEYCTYRKFTISVQFQTLLQHLIYTRFSETISIDGGGASHGVKEVNFGRGVRQRLRSHTKCVASQSGSASARLRFPDIPPPIWPHALRGQEPKITRNIKPRGGMSTGKVIKEDCEISWSYEYEWPDRLDGIPHFAVG